MLVLNYKLKTNQVTGKEPNNKRGVAIMLPLLFLNKYIQIN